MTIPQNNNRSYQSGGVGDIPVAEPVLLSEYNNNETTEEGPLLSSGGKKNDKDGSGGLFGYQVPSITNEQQQQEGYWGRFDDAPATVLPTYNDQPDSGPVATARLDDRRLRHQFIRKVYLILSAQLFVTFCSCAIITLHESTRNFVLGEYGMPLYWVNFVLLFVLICALNVYKRTHPTNMYLLSAFTLSMSYMVGIVTAMYSEAGAGDLVLEAVFVTASIFVVLTLYTLQSKQDFSFMGAGLGMGLWIMILWGLIAMIFGIQTGFVYALGGSILFSGFIIYDTYLLAERHDPQDYVIAAIDLYLDIINLFLYILQLLSQDRR